MADIQHSALTDTDGLHEPKGVGLLTAGSTDANKVYVSDGAGSGTWMSPSAAQIDGELSLGDAAINASPTTITALDTYYPVAGTWVEEHVDGLTSVVATGRIVIVAAGDYTVQSTNSIVASENSKVYSYAFLVNGTKTGPRIRRKQGTGTDVGSFALTTTLEGLIAGDYIQIGVAGITGDSPPTAGQTITLENSVFTAFQTGV